MPLKKQNSMGNLITQFLGFGNYGDEYKVMGLAPYGKPSLIDKLEKILILKEDGTFKLNLDYYVFINHFIIMILRIVSQKWVHSIQKKYIIF